jgi:glycosyltransferase involved in cell wall biosynthesis
VKQLSSLSVVMPVYNEAATVGEVIEAVLGCETGLPLQLVIVESNSSDGSKQIVQRYASDPRVTLVLQDAPRGKGAAVREGLRHVRGDIVLIQDGDLEYRVDDYPALLQPIRSGEATFVLGSRHVKGRPMRAFDNKRHWAWLMNVAHWLFTWMFNIVYGVRLRDPFTMYKVMTADAVRDLEFTANRFDFDWELVAKLIRTGHRPIEVPVWYQSRDYDQGKKVRLFRDPMTWIVALVRYRVAPIRRLSASAPSESTLQPATSQATPSTSQVQ